MTITAEDCKFAIKTSKTINPLLTYATDWQQLNEYNANNGDKVRVFISNSMDETVYVIERSYGLEVTTTKPDIQWSFEIQPYDQWEDWETILFRVYDQDYFNTHGHYENEFLANQIKNLIPGSVEVSEGMFKNPNFTDHNFIEMMEYENFINMTPDLGEKPERPEPTEEGCGADECCGGSCSSGFSFNEDDEDDDDELPPSNSPTNLYCPNCGTQNVVTGDEPSSGGYFYVAEDTGSSTEWFDSAKPHRCNNCQTIFYMGD
jgi:hypothetical protein